MTDLLFAPPVLGTVLSLTGLPGGSNKIHDRSPYGNHGTIIGATWRRLPSGLWCLDFDGTDDEVRCTHSASLSISDALTLKAWVNPEDTGDYGQIFDKGGFEYFLTFRKTPTPYAGFYLLGVKSWAFSIPDLYDGTWHQLVATYNKDAGADNQRFYIDGSLHDKTTETGSITTNTDHLYIGERENGTFDYKGSMALVEIYNRDWTALEVQNSFNRERQLFGVW